MSFRKLLLVVFFAFTIVVLPKAILNIHKYSGSICALKEKMRAEEEEEEQEKDSARM